MYRTDFWTLWEKARVGCFENSIKTCILSRVKEITSPGWMHETSARAWCTGKTQRDRVEREVGGGIHVTPWLIHVNLWQKPLQYCKVISLQLIKINEKKIKRITWKPKKVLILHSYLQGLSSSQVGYGIGFKIKEKNANYTSVKNISYNFNVCWELMKCYFSCLYKAR